MFRVVESKVCYQSGSCSLLEWGPWSIPLDFPHTPVNHWQTKHGENRVFNTDRAE